MDDHTPAKRREFNMGPATIGSRPCEISLNLILIEIKDPYIAQKVMNIHQGFKGAAKTIRRLFKNARPEDKKLAPALLKFLREKYERSAQNLTVKNELIPLIARTHLRCCIVSEYKYSINVLSGVEQETENPGKQRHHDGLDLTED